MSLLELPEKMNEKDDQQLRPRDPSPRQRSAPWWLCRPSSRYPAPGPDFGTTPRTVQERAGARIPTRILARLDAPDYSAARVIVSVAPIVSTTVVVIGGSRPHRRPFRCSRHHAEARSGVHSSAE